MSFTPGAPAPFPMVSPYTGNGPFGLFSWSFASSNFESPSRAVYLPIFVACICVVRRLWWANGSTVSASYNVDCGIYTDAGGLPGARIISTGSTAQGTATQVQFVNVTDTMLAPGSYWIALTASSSSATFFRDGSALMSGLDATGRFQEASALPLPATATPAESSSVNLYLCGFATTASP